MWPELEGVGVVLVYFYRTSAEQVADKTSETFFEMPIRKFEIRLVIIAEVKISYYYY